MIENCGLEFLKGVAMLAVSLLFLLNGFSLSAIRPLKNIVTEETLVRGCCILSIIYFVTFTIMGMVDDHHGVFLIITFILLFLSTMASCGFLAQKEDEYNRISWIFPAYISGLIISFKLLYTSYFLIEKAVYNDLDFNDDETKFLFNSLIMELLLSLFYSLTPYLICYNVDNDKHGKIFTVWALEYCDVVSHLIVALSYGIHLDHTGWDNNILTAYYVIYAINVIIFALPMPLIPLFDRFAVYHMLFSDIVTDIPMLAVTIYSKSFVGNMYITIDMIVKVIVFGRGLVWVPIMHGFCQCPCLKNSDYKPQKNKTTVYNQYVKL